MTHALRLYNVCSGAARVMHNGHHTCRSLTLLSCSQAHHQAITIVKNLLDSAQAFWLFRMHECLKHASMVWLGLACTQSICLVLPMLFVPSAELVCHSDKSLIHHALSLPAAMYSTMLIPKCSSSIVCSPPTAPASKLVSSSKGTLMQNSTQSCRPNAWL